MKPVFNTTQLVLYCFIPLLIPLSYFIITFLITSLLNPNNGIYNLKVTYDANIIMWCFLCGLIGLTINRFFELWKR